MSIMTKKPAKPEVIERIRKQAFPDVTPEELGLYNERLLDEFIGWDGKVYSLGGLEYNFTLPNKTVVEFGIKHSGEKWFNITVCPPGYTMVQRPCEVKDLAADIRHVIKHITYQEVFKEGLKS